MITKFDDFLNESMTAKKWDNTIKILIKKYGMEPDDAYFAAYGYLLDLPGSFIEKSNHSPKQIAKSVWEEIKGIKEEEPVQEQKKTK